MVISILVTSTTTGMSIDTGGNVTATGTLNGGSGISTMKYLYVTNPDGRNTHFCYSDNNQNYIRGKLNVDQDSIYCGGYIGIGIDPFYPLHLCTMGPNAYV